MSDLSLQKTLFQRRSCRSFSDRPVSRLSLQNLLWAAQGVTDDRDNRTAPSAHALHPLRLLVSIAHVEEETPGLYSVGADGMALTKIIDGDQRDALERAALEDQPWVGKAAGIITIAADLVSPTTAFADQPPYGVRGLRYVHIEAGAAAQNICLQATAEELGSVLVAGFRDEATADVLSLEAPVAPILHICFGWPA